MQILDERDVVEVVDGPVTLVKSALDLGRENVSGVRLTVRSSSSERVSVQIVEEFPGHVSMSDVQVHPSYGPHRWTISEQAHRMVFEDELPPGGIAKTIYGVRMTHDGALDPFLGRPELVVEGVAAEAGGAPERTAADGPAASPDEPGADSGPSAAAERPAESAPQSAPERTTSEDQAERGEEASTDVDSSESPFVYGEDREESSAEPEDSKGRLADRPVAASAGGSADPVEVLIERVARADLSSAQERALREALDLAPATSEQIQLERLQSSVTELSAFADEFETFVDAVGRPAETVEALEASIQELSARVEQLSATDRTSETDHEALRERVERLEADLDGLREDHGSSMDDLDDRLAELETVFDADEFDAIREVIEAERAWRERPSFSRSGRLESVIRSPAQ